MSTTLTFPRALCGNYLDPTPIGAGAGSAVFRARRRADDRAVVLKLLLPGSDTAARRDALRRAGSLSGQADSEHVCRVLAVVEDSDVFAVEMEDVGGTSLATPGPLGIDAAAALDVGIQVAAGLQALHAQGILHAALCPQHIVRAPRTGRVQLVGLGSAVSIGTRAKEPTTVSRNGAASKYAAPELTGRVDLPARESADLYALGGVLHELMAGAPPFDDSDILGRIHRQLAVSARSLAEIRPDLPDAVCRVVAKLLCPAPSGRYRTAAGLEADLREVAATLRLCHPLPGFVPGRRDAAPAIRRPAHVYGRCRELEQLDLAVRSVQERGAAFILVTGPAGVGKTHLVESQRLMLAGGRGLFGQGKNDQLHSAPFGALVQALRAAARSVLTLPDAGVAEYATALRSGLGTGAALAAGLVPELGILLGQMDPPPPLPPAEAHNRFRLTLRRLVQSLAAPRPLVLFLDDLQWADSSTTDLLAGFLREGRLDRVVLIGAARTNGSGVSSELLAAALEATGDGMQAHRLELEGLEPAEVADLVGDCLECASPESRPLAEAVHGATGGNPLDVIRVLGRAHAEGLVNLDRDRRTWTWDLRAVDSLARSETALSLGGSSLDVLPPAVLDVVRAAACLGTEIDVARLAIALGSEASHVRTRLSPAIAEGLVMARSSAGRRQDGFGDGGSVSHRFVHDRVREAVYEGMEPGQREALHLELGRRLAGAAGDDVGLFFSGVEQLLLAERAMTSDDERAELAALLLRAGESALDRAGWAEAARYLGSGARVAPPGCDPDMEWQLHRNLAVALQMCGRFEDAEDALRKASRLGPARGRIAEVRRARVAMLVQSNRYAEAVREGLDALRAFGHELPPFDEPAAWGPLIQKEMMDTAMTLRAADVERLLAAEPMSDLDGLAQMALLAETLNPSYLFPHTLPIVTARMVGLSLRLGTAPQSPLGYAAYGVLCCATSQYAAGQTYGRLAMDLVARDGLEALEPGVTHLYVHFVNHWTRPVDTGIPLATRAVGTAIDHGLFGFAGWLSMNVVTLLLERGAPLPGLLQQAREYLRLAHDTIRYGDAAPVMEGLVHALAGLAGRPEAFEDLRPERRTPEAIVQSLRHYEGGTYYPHLAWLQAATVMGDGAARRQNLDGLRPLVATRPGLFGATDFVLYEALLLVDEGAGGEGGREVIEEALAQRLAMLETWASCCAENHAAKRSLVAAELFRLQGRHAEATQAYIDAVEAATTSGFLHIEAIALERDARFHFERGRPEVARSHLRRARDVYARWGAAPKVAAMTEEHPFLALVPRAPPDGIPLDADALIRASRSIAGEMDPAKLVDRLMGTVLENAGAQRGALFLVRAGQLVVAATAAAPGVDVCLGDLWVAADGAEAWPAAVIRFVRRTGEVVVLESAETHPLFGSDPWIREHRTRSVLCLPLEHRGAGIGVLYLENDLLAGAFTPRRVEVIRVLAALAASALEQARLCEDLVRAGRELEATNARLSQYSGTLERAVAERTRELFDVFREHRVTLDALTDGVLRVDPEGRVRYANPATERLTGYTAGELVGAVALDLLLPSTPDGAAVTTGLLGGACERPLSQPLELALRRRDGRQVSVEVGWHPVVGDGGMEGGVATLHDMTAHRLLEQQLRHAQKMEAIGRFAGGVAHELNNLLTPILGHLSLLRRQCTPGDSLSARVEALMQATERAGGLTKQILAFSRRSGVFLRPTELGAVVTEVMQFWERSMDSTVDMRWSEPAEGCWFNGDSSLIQQVLLNLGANALDAVQDAVGRGLIDDPWIAVGVTRLVREERDGHPSDLPDDCLLLWVSDNGIGMDEETASRAFEPYFTTKQQNRGTGLGLSIVYGIIQQHGGQVHARSEPGHGSTFYCYLPACAAQEVPRTRPTDPELPPLGRGQTILVADDEELVRDLAREVLEEHGYVVVQARDGRSAIEIFGAEHAKLGLVLLDLTMPGMSGAATLARMRELDPGVPVVLWSGYSAQAQSPDSISRFAAGFLEKPFRVRDLLGAVHAAVRPGKVQEP